MIRERVPDTFRRAFDPPVSKEYALNGLRVTKATAWIAVTDETWEEGPFIRDLMDEHFWNWKLRDRGFPGRVRCARCNRSARCVHVVGDRLYGESCARLVSAS